MCANKNTELLDEINALVGKFKTVLMATSSVDGDPEISYSPFVIVEGQFVVYRK